MLTFGTKFNESIITAWCTTVVELTYQKNPVILKAEWARLRGPELMRGGSSSKTRGNSMQTPAQTDRLCKASENTPSELERKEEPDFSEAPCSTQYWTVVYCTVISTSLKTSRNWIFDSCSEKEKGRVCLGYTPFKDWNSIWHSYWICNLATVAIPMP